MVGRLVTSNQPENSHRNIVIAMRICSSKPSLDGLNFEVLNSQLGWLERPFDEMELCEVVKIYGG